MSSLSRCIRPATAARWSNTVNGLRRYSTPKANALPLEGYRVLDMTRVLAGVSLSPIRCPFFPLILVTQNLLYCTLG